MHALPPVQLTQSLQNEVLAAIAQGAPLGDVCELICTRLASAAPHVRCQIVAVDDAGCMHPLAATGLPQMLLAGFEGLPIGPDAGCCGAAAWLGEAVEVIDIASDPRCEAQRAAAMQAGLRACWASPIKAHDGRVIGVFEFYFDASRHADEFNRDIVEKFATLCAIASERDETQKRVHRLGYFDALTDLPNRALLNERGTQWLAALRDNEVLQLLHVDVDDFASINETYGQPTGDALLREITARLASCLDDASLLARRGSHSFAMLSVANAASPDWALAAQKFLVVLDGLFDIDQQRISVGASIGVATSEGALTTFAELSRHADLALHDAKKFGGRVFRAFEPAMEGVLHTRRSLMLDLRNAFEAGDFRLDYQPIIELESNRLVGVEALLRWRHDRHGDVSPTTFIPIVEEMGLIGALGDWVIREACQTAAGWPRELSVSVNLSPLQLTKRGLVLDVVSALHQSDLPAKRLKLEVTESALIARDAATRIAMHELHDYGVRLSIDDFGTGFASLQSLRAFPFDCIKIDMSFVRDIGIDADSAAIVRAVIGLAGELGILTAAEGIESESQRDWLCEHGCDLGQGYWFARPMDSVSLQTLLEQSLRDDELIVPG